MAALRTQQSRQRDLLNVPVIGGFLRWKHARTSMQAVLLAVSALILYDGFWGPQLAPKNVAGVLPWVHWRGLVVLALLIAGNLFCMACPFMLPRRLAKKLFPANRPWPKVIRSKWAGDWRASCLLLGVRGFRPVGKPLAHRVGGAHLLCRRLCHRRHLQGCGLLQIRLSHRTIPLR